MKGLISMAGFILCVGAFFLSCAPFTRSGRSFRPDDLLPQDGEVQGWTRSGAIRSASDDEALYDLINGAADIYIGHHFKVFAGQTYEGSEGWFLEVEIYDMGEPAHARALYRDPKGAQTPHPVLKDVSAEARVDESRVFDYGVEFRKGRFFVRVVAFEKGEDALNAAVLFAKYVSNKITSRD